MDQARNVALVAELAGAGDVIAELLGITCARNARGDLLSEGQQDAIRGAILSWRLMRSTTVEASRAS